MSSLEHIVSEVRARKASELGAKYKAIVLDVVARVRASPLNPGQCHADRLTPDEVALMVDVVGGLRMEASDFDRDCLQLERIRETAQLVNAAETALQKTRPVDECQASERVESAVSAIVAEVAQRSPVSCDADGRRRTHAERTLAQLQERQASQEAVLSSWLKT